MNSISVRGLGKRYRVGVRNPHDLWALKDVSFEVPRGTILGVIGPNGAGKTTLLKVLSRVTAPTTGSVTGFGRVVPLLALGAGFQAELTGRENIFLNAAMYGISGADVEARLDEIVEFAGLTDFLDMPVKRYSSGMYLRLAFSVAINMQPDVLLADEVLAVGDLEFQERCLERVQEGGRAGMTVLFVSHDMDAITRLCDRVLWLNSGEIVQIGDPAEVVAAYRESAWSVVNRARKTKRTGSHVCASGEILFARLTSSSGKEIGAARVEDEACVNIGVRTSLPRLRLRCQIDVSSRGMLAFRSVQPDLVPVETEGDVLATVNIPPHLLAETAYTVTVTIAFFEEDDRARTCILYNALSFQVYDAARGDSARGSYGGKMPGALAPRLAWSLVSAESPARSAS